MSTISHLWILILVVSAPIIGRCQTAPPMSSKRTVQLDEPMQKPMQVKTLLARLVLVKEIWDDQNGNINDANYLWLYGNRENLLPILIECIKSTKLMKSPYSIPTPPRFTAGDLAFYLLCDWDYLDFEKMVSPFVDPETYKNWGYLAYFDWVQRPGHREQLFQAVQNALKARLQPQ